MSKIKIFNIINSIWIIILITSQVYHFSSRGLKGEIRLFETYSVVQSDVIVTYPHFFLLFLVLGIIVNIAYFILKSKAIKSEK
jgi:hypothetical protein